MREIFLRPRVKDEYEMAWGSMSKEKIEEFLCEEHDFSRTRIQTTLAKIEEGEKARTQKSLEDWF